MATLYITEYSDLARADGTYAQAAQEPSAATQTVAIGGSSTASSAFNPATKFIELHTDAICSYAVGTAPTATAAKTRMAANQTKIIGVPNNQSYKIAVITNT